MGFIVSSLYRLDGIAATAAVLGCRPALCRLLPRHRNLESLFRRNQMILIIRPQIELDPVNFAAETVAAWAVIRRDRRTFILADVAGLIAGVDHRAGPAQAAF